MRMLDRRSCVAGGLGLLGWMIAPSAAKAWDPATALLSGRRWPGTRITYGFPTASFRWEYSTGFTSGFLAANATERALLRKALAEWAAASGGLLHFAEVGPRDAQV